MCLCLHTHTRTHTGWNDIGYSSTDLPEATPFMTNLAKQGIKLTHYYSQPSCTPSRVAMMTGKFPYKSGFQNYELQHTDAVGVPLSMKMVPEHLSDLGYATAGLGKWNIGHCNTKYLPHERGFDSFLGYMCPGHGYTDYACGLGSEVFDMLEMSATTDAASGTTSYAWETGKQYKGTYDTLLFRDAAVKAVKKHSAAYSADGTPLFIWAAQHGIHSEFDSDPNPPEELLTADNKAYLEVLEKRLGLESSAADKFFKMRKITASVLMSIDNALKSLVVALQEEDMLVNSVIFVHSDNGGDTIYTKGHPGNNYPMRSSKFGYFEGGVRVPAFVFAPSLIATARVGTSFHGLMHHVDLLPTFYGLGGGDTTALATTDPELDGMDMWSAITGETTGPRSELVLNLPRSTEWSVGTTKNAEGVALRVGNFKLLLNHCYDDWFSPDKGQDHNDAASMMASICQYTFYGHEGTDSECAFGSYLFDLAADPHERTNLWESADHAAVKAKLVSRAEELAAAQGDYGKILPEYWGAPPMAQQSATFEANDFFVTPWDCATIK